MVFGLRINSRHHVSLLIQALNFGILVVHSDRLLHGLTLFNLGKMDLLSYHPSFFNVQHLRYYWHNQSIPDTLDGLGAIHDAIGFHSFDFDAALSKFLLENFVVALNTFGNPDAARLYRDGVRMQFLINDGNNYFFILPIHSSTGRTG
jgi:hypothetical protein